MKNFVVIGLGRFGSAVAKTLYDLGYEVLAIDKDEGLVQDISQNVTHAIAADAVDEGVLKSLGVRNFQVAIVALGSDMQSSILVTLMLKEMGIENIIAKVQSEMHAKVLDKVGADRVVFPERDMGIRVANNLAISNILDCIEISPEYSVVEIVPPENWVGKTLAQLDIRKRKGINVIAIKHNDKVNISPGADEIISREDILVVVGNNAVINGLNKHK